VLGLDPGAVHLRVRRRRREDGRQYERRADLGERIEVRENGLRFLVNLTDYLDTGLFLDHRPLRALIRREVAGRRFLNLFAYTCTASVYAAAGGARSTTSVDLSAPYLSWGRDNLILNGFTAATHELVQAECRKWLSTERRRYDLVLLAPPSSSESKRMERPLDVRRDHPGLIAAAMAVLDEGGELLFASLGQGFALDPQVTRRFDVRDITDATWPRDFAKHRGGRQTFRIRAR
jgi:23S rRNA (guanine2445-N2)-methyltransferase / 23S rRNA (guanine2069-N7)-methyltransferase